MLTLRRHQAGCFGITPAPYTLRAGSYLTFAAVCRNTAAGLVTEELKLSNRQPSTIPFLAELSTYTKYRSAVQVFPNLLAISNISVFGPIRIPYRFSVDVRRPPICVGGANFQAIYSIKIEVVDAALVQRGVYLQISQLGYCAAGSADTAGEPADLRRSDLEPLVGLNDCYGCSRWDIHRERFNRNGWRPCMCRGQNFNLMLVGAVIVSKEPPRGQLPA